jgi:hypothetical protein
LGFHRQSKVPPTPKRKPRYKVTGTPEFREYLEELRKSRVHEDQELAAYIDNAIDVLGERPTAGDHIPTKLWRTITKYRDEPCLYRYPLDGGWRMIYSIRKPEDDPIVVWIIEVLGHPEYERRFHYD